MKRAAKAIAGISGQRGIWLRCFLGRMSLLLALQCLSASQVFCQSDCIGYKNLVVSKIEGRVFDPSGVPIPNALVTVTRNADMGVSDTTDANGSFSMPSTSGEYKVHAALAGFESAFAIIEVRHGLTSIFHRKSLWLILGVGGAEPCPTSTTSRAEFLKIIDEYNKKQNSGNKQNDATGK